MDGTDNSGGTITHEVEVNMFYKGHVERVQMDVCELEKTDIILDMLWLAAHNPESENNEISTIVWKNSEDKKKKREKRRREENSEMGSE